MKKVLLGATLLFSVMTFAQKEELKTLKKIYAKAKPSDKDLVEYETAIKSLEGLATEEADKVYKNFYKGMFPMVKLASLGEKVTPNDQLKLATNDNLDNLAIGVNETLEYEKNTGKKVYTDDIKTKLSTVKPLLIQLAFQYNNEKKFKEASNLFYKVYKLDKSDGLNLENAANLAVQAQEYKNAEKLYEELSQSDYLNNGVLYFAINKATGEEEMMLDKATRLKMISLGTHEKPRDEKIAAKKPEVYKMIALLSYQNGNFEKAIPAFEKAKQLNPNDETLISEEALMHYNMGYKFIENDEDLVNELNKNLDNKTKFDELTIKRKDTFKKALPYFEKAYSINQEDNGIRSALRISYEILDMKDKLKALEN